MRSLRSHMILRACGARIRQLFFHAKRGKRKKLAVRHTREGFASFFHALEGA